MWKWLFGNRTEGMIEWNLKDLKNNLSVAETFDPDLRRRMARDFYLTQLLIETPKSTDVKISELKELGRLWASARHHALNRGAKSEADVEWNNAACIESWILAEVAVRQELVNSNSANQISNLMTHFIATNLPQSEREEVETVYRTNSTC